MSSRQEPAARITDLPVSEAVVQRFPGSEAAGAVWVFQARGYEGLIAPPTKTRVGSAGLANAVTVLAAAGLITWRELVQAPGWPLAA